MNTREISDTQEIRIAKLLKGRIQCNSGGTLYGGGDVHTKFFFIEAKSPSNFKKSFAIKKEWLDKAKEQCFQQGKQHYSVAFSYGDDKDYFIIDTYTMKLLVSLLESEE